MTGSPTPSDRVGVVTGATGGMGAVIVEALARRRDTVLAVGRDIERTSAVVESLRDRYGLTTIRAMAADMSRLDDIRELAATIRREHGVVDVLVNNAGAHIATKGIGVDGFEMNWTVNHLSSFLLTQLLLPALTASEQGRIVNVSSNSMPDTLDLAGLGYPREPFSAWTAYGEAKLAVLVTSYALARQNIGTVTVNALHPGIVGTGIIDGLVPRRLQILTPALKRFFLTPEQGAASMIRLATDPLLSRTTGSFFVKNKLKQSNPVSRDASLQDAVWSLSKEQTAVDGDS